MLNRYPFIGTLCLLLTFTYACKGEPQFDEINTRKQYIEAYAWYKWHQYAAEIILHKNAAQYTQTETAATQELVADLQQAQYHIQAELTIRGEVRESRE
jgi:hypothetical protein